MTSWPEAAPYPGSVYDHEPEDVDVLGWDEFMARQWESIFAGYRGAAGLRKMCRRWSDLIGEDASANIATIWENDALAVYLVPRNRSQWPRRERIRRAQRRLRAVLRNARRSQSVL